MDDVKLACKYWSKAKSCIDRKIEFKLTFVQYKKLMLKTNCFYTNVAFDLKPNKPHSLTIDRVDASKGYVHGNCVACTSEINSKKKRSDIERA